MTRLSFAIPVCALLAATGTVVAVSRGLYPRTIVQPVSVTATTDDLEPLLHASIDAARQAREVCAK